MAMEYLACENLCIEALNLALQQKDYDTYARILMPLQEARRQRRQSAEDIGVFILNADKLTPQQILDQHPQGCLMLINPPYNESDLYALREEAINRKALVQVSLIDK